MTDTCMTTTAFARRVGLSRTRIHQLVSEGLPVEENGRIDPVRGEAWIAENIDEERSRRRKEAPADFATAAEARRDKAVTDAARAKLALERERGALVDRGETERAIFARARGERDAWLMWPLRIASGMSAELAVPEDLLRPVLARLVREHLETLSVTSVDDLAS